MDEAAGYAIWFFSRIGPIKDIGIGNNGEPEDA